LRAVGRRGGSQVAFEIVLGAAWRRSGDPPITTFKGTVTFVSLGPPSHAFVRELDRAYETKLAPAMMADSVSFTALSLEGNPSRLASGPVKIKLFFEGSRPEAYAELFLNIDNEARRVELREKDPEYRTATIRALARP
jgi:hypothetical protein